MSFHRRGCTYPSDPCSCLTPSEREERYKEVNGWRTACHTSRTKNAAMLALLERWVNKFKNLPDVSYGMWLRDSAKAKDHHKLFSLLTDTKALLKEAKEVKHAKG